MTTIKLEKYADDIEFRLKDVAINESSVLVRILVSAAYEYLGEYLLNDDALSPRRHMLAAAARDVIFTACFVDTDDKHGMLLEVAEKLMKHDDTVPPWDRKK